MMEVIRSGIFQAAHGIAVRANYYYLCLQTREFERSLDFYRMPEHLKTLARISDAIDSVAGSKREPFTLATPCISNTPNGRSILYRGQEGVYSVDNTDLRGEMQHAFNIQEIIFDMIVAKSSPEAVEKFLADLSRKG